MKVIRHGERVFQTVGFEIGVPRDIGWATAVIHPDMTVERICKGCGASARTPLTEAGIVIPVAFYHREGCTVMK